jgi:hypothetical protein
MHAYDIVDNTVNFKVIDKNNSYTEICIHIKKINKFSVEKNEVYIKMSLTYTKTYAIKNLRRERHVRIIVKLKNACISLMRIIISIKQILWR